MAKLSKVDWFLDIIKQVENSQQVGFDGKLWSPHSSLEGGADTIGYGHKLNLSKVYIDGKEIDPSVTSLTSEQVEKLLKQDIDKAELRARKQYTAAGNPAGEKWEDLSTVKKAMFTEIVYNIGTLNNSKGKWGWPSLAKAMKKGDEKEMYKQLGRTFTDPSGKKIKLEGRVKDLVKAYKKNNAPAAPTQSFVGVSPDIEGLPEHMRATMVAMAALHKPPVEPVEDDFDDPDLVRTLEAERELQAQIERERAEVELQQQVEQEMQQAEPEVDPRDELIKELQDRISKIEEQRTPEIVKPESIPEGFFEREDGTVVKVQNNQVVGQGQELLDELF